MTGRPARHWLLANIQLSGGWPAVVARIAIGETVTQIARSFNVSRGFFARVVHEDLERHELVLRVRNQVGGAVVDKALGIVRGAKLTPEGKDVQEASDIRYESASGAKADGGGL